MPLDLLSPLKPSLEARAIFWCAVMVVSALVLASVRSASLAQGKAEQRIEVAEQKMVAAAKQQHVATLRVIEERKARAAATKETAPAVARALELQPTVQIVTPTSLAVVVTSGAPPVITPVPVQVTMRIEADSVAIAKLMHQVARDDALIAALDAQLMADSTALAGRDDKIAGLEALKTPKGPRCGRKCGIVIGVVGTIASAITVRTVLSAANAAAGVHP